MCGRPGFTEADDTQAQRDHADDRMQSVRFASIFVSSLRVLSHMYAQAHAQIPPRQAPGTGHPAHIVHGHGHDPGERAQDCRAAPPYM